MIVVGLVRRNPALGERALMNSAAIIQEGKLIGYHDKVLLPTYDVFDERRYFEPGQEFRAWKWKGKKIGVLICEDIWQYTRLVTDTQYACDPVIEIRKLGVDLLLNLLASPYHFEKAEMRVRVCQKAAETLKCPVILCAQDGGNDQLVLMPSRFSSKGSITDAEALAKNLGVKYTEVSIEPLYETYLKILKPFFEGKSFDTTEENIQARIREMILMAFSNKFSRKGEVIPHSTLEKAPSAELRSGQRDADTLPDYAMLDVVLEGYVEDYLSPAEIASKHHIPIEVVKDIVHQVHLAEYKKRQAPIGIRVTRKAFKMGHRYPIVQKWK